MWIEVTTMGDLVDRAATRAAGDAIVFPDLRFTYPELSDRTTEAARSLRGLGVGAGDKVGILMPNCIDFVTVLFGAAKLGAVVVPINARFRTFELGTVIAHADIRTLVTIAAPTEAADYPGLLASAFPDAAGQDPRALSLAAAPMLRQIVDLASDPGPGFLGRDDFDAAASSVPVDEVRTLQQRVRIRDIALLMYTSGTTAQPKGCLITHEALVRHGRNVAISRFKLTSADRFWDPLPLFHIGGIVPMLGCFSVEATYFHAGHFDADVALRTLEQEKVTVAYPAFETIWLGILNHPRFDEADLSAIRLVQNIAVPDRLRLMQKQMPWAKEVSSFGATECSSNLTLTDPDDPDEIRMSTLGKPLPGMEIRIVDLETGRDSPPDETGELQLRGYARFESYYKDPELTATTIDADGWFSTGDLGRIDADGRLSYQGRLKDMIKVGGENVAAVEVESFLATNPSIDIVQVVGVPDDRYSEVTAAFVELKPGAELLEQQLIEFCAGQIASYKIPRYVRFVSGEWPMSGTKIQKFRLRERLAEELAERGISEAPRVSSGS
jgi:fatty-acyl-CoA synthase